MRQLIICPQCKISRTDLYGYPKQVVLGELLGMGTVAIARQRRKYSYADATIVIGNDFSLVCGYCRTIVMITGTNNYMGTMIVKYG